MSKLAVRVSGLIALIACSVLSVTGCGGGGSNLPEGKTGTVSGKVTFQGQPIPKDSVVLFVNAKSGLPGTGVVDASGEYRLTMREGSDVLCGDYRVVVTPPPPPTASLSQDEIMKLQSENKLPPIPEVKEIPARYRAAETTPLTFSVEPKANRFDIDMKEKD